MVMGELDRISETGAVIEIGVHHGKSFIHLLQSGNTSRPFIAIDVFDDQLKNLDKSGRGDLGLFKQNLRKHVSPQKMNDVNIMSGSSLETTQSDIMLRTNGSRVALFSVDGCHNFECTLSDLNLAYNMLEDYGLIMVDDYFNPAWPGVAVAVGAFLQQRRLEVAAIAFGENKFYITKTPAAAVWFRFFQEKRCSGVVCEGAYCGPCVRHTNCANYNAITGGSLIEIRA